MQSPGPSADNIHPCFLKQTAFHVAIAPFLTLIFQASRSVHQSVASSEWKKANVSPM